jgi:hypothetical protein
MPGVNDVNETPSKTLAKNAKLDVRFIRICYAFAD